MKKLSQLSSAILVFISRFGWLPPNISPVGSFGFFSHNPLLFVGTILAFDYFMGGFYPGFLFTYAGFVGYWLLGRVAQRRLKHQLILLPLASFLFYALSNLGVWWYWYPRSVDGLILCYVMAWPFYRQTLIGDIVFGYGWLLLTKLYSRYSYVLKIRHSSLTVTSA